MRGYTLLFKSIKILLSNEHCEIDSLQVLVSKNLNKMIFYQSL